MIAPTGRQPSFGALRRAVMVALAAAPLAFGMAAPAQAKWLLPSVCTHGATGDDIDSPVVEYYHNTETVPSNDAVRLVVFDNSGYGAANVNIQGDSSDHQLLVVTYTPFLISAWTPQFKSSGWQRLPLAPAGFSSSPQQKVYSSAAITINDPTSGKPLPGANVMWTPYFYGGDPFFTTADQNGVITIDCFQSLPLGNPVYIVSANGQVAFDAAITITSSVGTVGFGSNK